MGKSNSVKVVSLVNNPVINWKNVFECLCIKMLIIINYQR